MLFRPFADAKFDGIFDTGAGFTEKELCFLRLC